ncbi:MAG: 30S ribosomal protein S12 methylthiotransferase RimO [Epulopiscium sp.]|jgi:ribosomal protein S12 methylthiotransferase|nr:30S ribosomal protein S12 methylthiotransferase RimO [Candidatus Epulonipiscium sp.]
MKGTVAFTSLGCDKNRVDSEVMLGLLQQEDFRIVADEKDADILVVNTCCFIKDALEESIETILEMAKYKETGRCKGLIVAGCLGQRYEEDIFQEMPEVDAVIGTASYEAIAEVAERLLQGEKEIRHLEDIHLPMRDENGKLRMLSTPGYFAYLKISEGCDNLCTYCVIPKIRGRHRSRTIESLVEEATLLASQGVKELVLVAQDTSIYGRDLYGEIKLPELLQALCNIEGIEWIRILYCYPETLTDKTIEIMAKEEKICHYIDMPIQHGCDSVLKRMGRKSSQDLIRTKIQKLREAMPDIAIRTTLIVGFPGETEEEFSELCSFIQEMKFERLGVFTYSQEEGTPAAQLPDQIEEEVKDERKNILMEIQKGISADYCMNQVGKEVSVLIEGKLPQEEIYCARTKQDAPDIDGLVFVSATEELISGDIVKVEILESSDYDLIGEVVYGDELGQ